MGTPNPGITSKTEYTTSEILRSNHKITKAVKISSAAVDAGNTPTTTLRKGLVLGIVTASGEYAQYDDGAGDGTEVAAAILLDNVNMLDDTGVAEDKEQIEVLLHGIVDESALIGIDANGKADLPLIIFD